MPIFDLQEGTECDRAAVASVPSLGNTTDLTSTVNAQQLTELPPPTTVKAWYLRSFARELLKKAGLERRMRYCGAKLQTRLQGVSIYRRPDRVYGRVGGVCMCGQSLACPVCAPRIAAFRAAQVSECYKRAITGGFQAKLCTFTLPHSSNTPLSVEIQVFQAAWKHYQNGRKCIGREKDSLGNHLAREVTWGELHGWNYHQHQLRYDKPGTYNDDLNRAQWLAALDYVGRLRSGADRHAFDAGVVGSEAGARYVAKLSTSVEAQARSIGSEIASSATKGRNFASLLLAATQGDLTAAKTWTEGVAYVTAKKVSSVRWSRGLRDAVGMGEDKTDAQVSQEEVLKTDEFLGALLPWQWRGILKWRAEFPLVIAANNGADAVNHFLSGLDLGSLNEEPPTAVQTPIKGDYAYARLQSPISHQRPTHHEQTLLV